MTYIHLLSYYTLRVTIETFYVKGRFAVIMCVYEQIYIICNYWKIVFLNYLLLLLAWTERHRNEIEFKLNLKSLTETGKQALQSILVCNARRNAGIDKISK